MFLTILEPLFQILRTLLNIFVKGLQVKYTSTLDHRSSCKLAGNGTATSMGFKRAEGFSERIHVDVPAKVLNAPCDCFEALVGWFLFGVNPAGRSRFFSSRSGVFFAVMGNAEAESRSYASAWQAHSLKCTRSAQCAQLPNELRFFGRKLL